MTPSQLGLAGAAQLALIIRTVTEKGKTTITRQYFVTSRPIDRLEAASFLLLRRDQWGIESISHQRLDVSLHEDQQRVRSVKAAAVLCLLSRVSLALFVQWCQEPHPVRDKTYPVWSGRLKKRPGSMLLQISRRCLPP